ncbi:hypothetical protein BaRGS_00010414, partial [Batillaria attramentaria]
WTIALLSWTCAACICCFIFVHYSHCAQQTFAMLSSSTSASTDEEKRPLLGPKSSDGTSATSERQSVKKEHSGRGSSLFHLARISVPDLSYVLLGLVFLVFTVTCEMLIPYYVGRVIEGLVIDKSIDAFHTAIVRLATVAAASMYVARVKARIRQTFFTSVLSQDLDFFDDNETGDLVSRLLTDTEILGNSLFPNLDQYLRGVITTGSWLFKQTHGSHYYDAVGAMGVMVTMSWRLAVVVAIFLPAFVVVAVLYGIVMKQIGVSGQSIMAVLGEMAEENFSNIRTVRSFATEEDEVQRFKGQVDNLYYYGKAEAWTHSSFQSLVRVSLRLCILFYGGHLVSRDLLPGGDLLTAVLYLEKINLSIVTINAVYGGMMKGVGASEVVFEYIDRKPRHGGQGSVVKDNFRGEIEFRDVTFAYPSRPHQTKMSFRVSPGEVVALVGPSGGGKSTCVSLLQNFYRPSSGHVMLDGIPVHSYKHRSLHSKMALVGQEPVLFSRSLRENIAYGLRACSDFDVTSSAKQANAHDFICAMRDGYSTCAGEKGLQLSGGQKQRVAIARALVRDPAVLILDEATSALDSQSEAKVQEALSNSRQGRTVLVIAHRLSTVEAADRVLVVDKGRVVEDGPPSYLLALGGLYSALVRKQLIATGSQPVVPRYPLPVTSSAAEEGEDSDDERRSRDSSLVHKQLDAAGSQQVVSLGPVPVFSAEDKDKELGKEQGLCGRRMDSRIAQKHWENFKIVNGIDSEESAIGRAFVHSSQHDCSVVPAADSSCETGL